MCTGTPPQIERVGGGDLNGEYSYTASIKTVTSLSFLVFVHKQQDHLDQTLQEEPTDARDEAEQQTQSQKTLQVSRKPPPPFLRNLAQCGLFPKHVNDILLPFQPARPADPPSPSAEDNGDLSDPVSRFWTFTSYIYSHPRVSRFCRSHQLFPKKRWKPESEVSTNSQT